jgi:hypothetical protein
MGTADTLLNVMPHSTLIAVLLSSVLAISLTVFICRAVQSRRRRADWSVGFLCAIGGVMLGVLTVGILSILFVYHASPFDLESWQRDKPPLWLSMLAASLPSFAVGLVAALFVVGYHRKRFRDVQDVA